MVKKLIFWNFLAAFLLLMVDTERSALWKVATCYGYFAVSALLVKWKSREIREWLDGWFSV